MKRFLIAVSVALLVSAPFALGRVAIGQGGIQDSDGIVAVNFSVSQGTSAASLLVASDGHDDYPDVIIRMDHVDFAHFGRHTVTFGGTATLESEQITVRVTAVDAGKRDRFSITARDLDGNVVFHLSKALTSGDISIR